jgi:asparagine synthase (glutamine-hydrolysing)
MCGIAGMVCPGRGGALTAGTLSLMAGAIARRGPDGEGIWISGDGTAGFAHRRLAVVGRGPAGSQPMHSASGRYTITFNGEIYNFRQLARMLEERGYRFRSTGDTEVVLAAFEEWGVRSAVDRFVGMFAFGVWDAAERRLVLARDRLGKKPLFVTAQGGVLAFASQLDALLAIPGLSFSLDRAVFGQMVQFGAAQGSETVVREVRRVEAGTLETFAADGSATRERYWMPRVHGSPEEGPAASCDTADRFLSEAERLLRIAVRDRLVAEVPIGSFLSGGVDSAVVTALMQQESAERIKTYTVGFRFGDFDEAPAAEAVAAALGTEHHTFYIDEDEVIGEIERLPRVFDEPFGDPSALPMYLIAKLARSEVTVALSGDGGDEVFGGYNRHWVARALWPRVAVLPAAGRRLLRSAISVMRPDEWDGFFRLLYRGLPARANVSMMGLKLEKVKQVLGHDDLASAYVAMKRTWIDLPEPVLGEMTKLPSRPVFKGAGDEQARQMMLEDLRTYLVDDVLVKVDRATMASGLEARAPLLDHRLVEMTLSAPTRFLLSDSTSKPALRRIAARHLPAAVLQRPKAGFAPPIEHWLRGPLRPWVESTLGSAVADLRVLDSTVVQSVVDAHMSGRRQLHYPLWALLMAQSWLNDHAGRIKLAQ